MRKKIVVKHQGRMGNRLMQYFVAKSLQTIVPGSDIFNVDIPELGIKTATCGPDLRMPLFSAGHDFSLHKIAFSVNKSDIPGIELSVFGARLEHFPQLEVIKEEILPLLPVENDRLVRNDELLIHIRAEDVLLGVHCDYPLIPIQYYKDICERHEMRPVFFGQIGEDVYSKALRASFPEGRFLNTDSVLRDFSLMQSCRYFVCSVSSFAWLGCWLSPLVEVIHLPVHGLLNPNQRPDIDLLPTTDKRYSFRMFPTIHWTASDSQVKSIIYGDDPSSFISTSELDMLLLDKSLQ